MSSILTNNGAMVALQTLKSINTQLGDTQNVISTGKSVSSAKDNASIWAISKVMESDVKGFKGISDSLSLGESTLAVAASASETITDLLTDIKGKIVAAQEENVDRTKIQTDISALTDQINSVVGAAQFNGLNLIDGTSADDMKVLSSLDRSSDGSVSASHISVERQSLSVTTSASAQSFGTTDAADATAAAGYMSGTTATIADDAAYATGTNMTSVADGADETITVGSVAAGVSYQLQLSDLNINVVGGGSATGDRTFEYVAGADDSAQDVATNLKNQISSFFEAATDTGDYTVALGGTNGNEITISNDSGTAIDVGQRIQTGGTAGSSAASGGLGALSTIDVTSDAGATGALSAIDGLIKQSIDAAAAFGSAQGRVESQSDFVSTLTDSLKSGIGSMVDADMEETSARLQALQVQQQLGVQSLSMANQAPQSILSLFR
ncbi:flagellin [Pacificibacter marinus]|uniref:Flagellin n=1 Tax=Pacificibacter marinus TaxID=658057 RepID=A0A1Y5T3B5_9RHOB|nr:flagellin [Pacificibacter marinus]SEL05716.1 flagellin [Pacificibacter marinus]SLN51356.1 Flagellin [Pacificibacter marinus]